MPPRLWLVIDANNLASRMFYAMPPLIVHGRQTGAINGFLKTVIRLRDEFAASGFVFCFDAGEPLRKKILPEYQSGRGDGGGHNPDKDKRYLHCQLYELRRHVLPNIGFSNVLSQDGYEADDLVAAACNHWSVKRAVVVSSDKDLYQCLSSRPDKHVTQYDLTLKREVDEGWFSEKYAVRPSDWPLVKAIAGCTSDNIPGVHGVGPVKAAQFVNGTMKSGTNTHALIRIAHEITERNEILTTLPYAGLKVPELKEDTDNYESWEHALGGIGATQLMRGI